MLQNASALLFDLDGTLTDPKEGITNCIIHALVKLGRPAPEADELLWCIGPPLYQSFAKLLATEDVDLIRQAVALYRERYSVIGLFENALIDGIVESLEAVSPGRRVFVATAKPTVFAVPIVEKYGLSRFFERVYGSELSGERSDKGDLIQHLLASEGLDPKSTVMIGDREHDCLGAGKWGVPTIGVLWGYGSHEELVKSGAAEIVRDPSELARVLMRRADVG